MTLVRMGPECAPGRGPARIVPLAGDDEGPAPGDRPRWRGRPRACPIPRRSCRHGDPSRGAPRARLDRSRARIGPGLSRRDGRPSGRPARSRRPHSADWASPARSHGWSGPWATRPTGPPSRRRGHRGHGGGGEGGAHAWTGSRESLRPRHVGASTLHARRASGGGGVSGLTLLSFSSRPSLSRSTPSTLSTCSSPCPRCAGGSGRSSSRTSKTFANQGSLRRSRSSCPRTTRESPSSSRCGRCWRCAIPGSRWWW